MRSLAVMGLTLALFQAQGDARKQATERMLDASAPPSAPAPVDSGATRAAQVALIRARYGALLRDPAVIAELRLHARRVARLDAMERVAKASGKDALLPRIQKLREREDARLEKRIAFLKTEKKETTR